MWLDYLTHEEHLVNVLQFAVIGLAVLTVTVVSMKILFPGGKADSPTVRLSTVRSPWENGSRFLNLEIVRTSHELNYSHGGGLMIPAGSCLQLISLHQTTSGPRWSAKWISDEEDSHGIYVYPIPEEFLEPLMLHS